MIKENFIKFLRYRLRPSSFETAYRIVKQLDDNMNWQSFWREKEKISSTSYLHLITWVMKMYNEFAEQNGYEPVMIPRIRHQENLVVPKITYEEVWKIIDELPERTYNQLLFKTMCVVGASYGLRLSEIIELQKKGIDLTNRIFSLSFGKRGNSTIFKMTPKVFQYIDGLLKSQEEKGIKSPYLFVRQDGTRYSRAAFQMRVKRTFGDFPHKVFRHTLAIYLAEQNTPLYVIQRILRHKSPSVTMRYIGNMENVVNEVLQKIGGQKDEK